MTEVSVIMATYKEPENQLRRSIESILNQTYKAFEYIIILDNPDNSDHIRIIKEYQQKDNRIQFHINEKNQGLTYSLNRGLSYANGKYICRMDADDISVPERLQWQKEYLEKCNVDLIGGITQVIDEEEKVIYSIKKIPANPDKIKKCIRYNQVVPHPTWFGRKEMFEHLNGYRKIPLCEDYDFTLRALLKGYRVSNLNKVVLQYRMTSQSISRNNLFEQFLYAKYITCSYKKGKIADVEKAKQYVTEKNSSKKAEKYLKANVRFNELLNDIEQKRYIHFFVDGVRFTFTSKEYLEKVYRFFMASINS